MPNPALSMTQINRRHFEYRTLFQKQMNNEVPIRISSCDRVLSRYLATCDHPIWYVVFTALPTLSVGSLGRVFVSL